MARDGRWLFKFSLHVEGKTGVGNPVDILKTIQVPLHTDGKTRAKWRAEFFFHQLKGAARRGDTEFFKQYCQEIDATDKLTLNGFRLVLPERSQELAFEKLVVPGF
jgi:hypothetical protein